MQNTLNITQPIEYSVTKLSNEIKNVVENNFGYVRVRGEISGLKIASSGHGYFNLKDETSLLACTCWRYAMAKVAIKLEDGIEIVAVGKISTYGGQSKYQLNVEQVEISGAGNLMQILQMRKEQLAKEGLFNSENKKPLPFMPQTIGVVTSITGAVIKDIIHRITDRFPSRILIWPTAVQGEGAAKEIAQAIDGFNQQVGNLRPDVIIVARGGGSIEDLWAFNEEVVVRSTFNSKIPIISAVGHETDFTLIDLAADVRAPTPTAAAEFAVPVLEDIRKNLNAHFSVLSKRLASYIIYKEHILRANLRGLDLKKFLLQKEQRFDDFSMRLTVSAQNYLQMRHFALHKYCLQILKPMQLIDNFTLKLAASSINIKNSLQKLYNEKNSKVELYSSLLQSLDTNNVLKRGFAIIRQEDRVISRKSQLNINKSVEINMHDGIVKIN